MTSRSTSQSMLIIPGKFFLLCFVAALLSATGLFAPMAQAQSASDACANLKDAAGICTISSDCMTMSCGGSLGSVAGTSLDLSGSIQINLCASVPYMQVSFDILGQQVAFNVTSHFSIPLESIGVASANLEVNLNENNSTGTYDLSLGIETTEGFCPVCTSQSFPIVKGIPIPIPTPDDCDYANAKSKRDAAEQERSTSCHISDYSLFYTQAGILIHVFAMLIGLLECFYGYRLFKLTLFLVGFIVVSVLVFVIAYAQLPNSLNGENISPISNENRREFGSFGIAIACGVAGGILTILLFFIGLFLLGAALGILAFVFLVLLMHQAPYFVAHPALLYSFMSFFGFCGGLLAIIFERFLIILSTSTVGAFGVMAAVDYFAEQGRAIAVLQASFSSQTLQPANCWFTYMTIFIWPVLAVVGFFSQYRCTSIGYDHAAGRRKKQEYLEMRQPGGGHKGGARKNALDDDDDDEPLMDSDRNSGSGQNGGAAFGSNNNFNHHSNGHGDAASESAYYNHGEAASQPRSFASINAARTADNASGLGESFNSFNAQFPMYSHAPVNNYRSG